MKPFLNYGGCVEQAYGDDFAGGCAYYGVTAAVATGCLPLGTTPALRWSIPLRPFLLVMSSLEPSSSPFSEKWGLGPRITLFLTISLAFLNIGYYTKCFSPPVRVLKTKSAG